MREKVAYLNTERSYITRLRCSACQFKGSLSNRVFETRTATGSELFSLLTCPYTTTFTLLSIFASLEMSCIKLWETIPSKHAKCPLPAAVRVSKPRLLKEAQNSNISVSSLGSNGPLSAGNHAITRGFVR